VIGRRLACWTAVSPNGLILVRELPGGLVDLPQVRAGFGPRSLRRARRLASRSSVGVYGGRIGPRRFAQLAVIDGSRLLAAAPARAATGPPRPFVRYLSLGEAARRAAPGSVLSRPRAIFRLRRFVRRHTS